MSALNVEQVLTESVESQPEPVGVSVSEISHNSRLESYSKPQNDHSFSNMTHQPKTVSEVHQNKESQPTPATDSLPLVSNAPPGQPSDQRSISAAANPHGSQQDLTHEGIPQPVHPHPSTLSGTESAPAISVVPSSPLTPGAPSNPMISSEVHRSLEPSTMSAADRRASRRRSAMDSSANHRLSGFFSNLLHLREREAASNTSANPPRNSTSVRSHSPSRALASSVPSSPLPKASEPLPPPFESPTLAELGLSLSVLTGDLPSHQFTAPTNGTFLSPHYLLLCHSQGLDVLPLVSPPKIQPYALVRRVAFKSVVVMEERGVLVAIAGRRDGVRVYALDEIRKAVEWRIEVELRRELEKNRREETRRIPVVTSVDPEKQKIKRKSASVDTLTGSTKSNTSGHKTSLKKKSKSNTTPTLPPLPAMPPSFPPPRLIPRTSIANFHIHRQANSRARAQSVAEAMGPQLSETLEQAENREDGKGEWMDAHHSDDEALVAAGPSGSAALDERTSAISAAAAASATASDTVGVPAMNLQQSSGTAARQRGRPSNLDLSHINNAASNRPRLSSPAPTLMSLRQALNQAPATAASMATEHDFDIEPGTPNGEVISFAEALLESRVPEAPPLGHRAITPAQAVVVTRFPLTRHNPSSHGFSGQGLPSSLSMTALPTPDNQLDGAIADVAHGDQSDQEEEMEGGANVPRAPSRSGGSLRASNRRHRWSVFDGVFRPSAPIRSPNEATRGAEDHENPRSAPLLTRTTSHVSHREAHGASRSGHQTTASQPSGDFNAQHRGGTGISRIFSMSKRTKRRERSASAAAASPETHQPSLSISGSMSEGKHSGSLALLPPQAPPPKLEYVKLPGTKGAVMVKAVETPKKSFLAILCGDHGEKVELFAGTYRTALALSRTFILPDSPKTLELQLQGDDLVEVFLVFSQNVFGLEPATVRVREVRIGRAERRAARRRANRGANRMPTDENNGEPMAADEEVMLTAIIAPAENTREGSTSLDNTGQIARTENRVQPFIGREPPPSATIPLAGTANGGPQPPAEIDSLPQLGPPTTPHPDEVATAALMAMGPYTTFQQLSFAPNFPLATLAEDCIIPPSYRAVKEYKKLYEPEDRDLTQGTETSETPEDLNIHLHDVQWFYKDPKGIIRGPWPSSLMQSWFNDGFLPPDLPVRRENEEEYISLQILQSQSIDATSPFRPPPPGLALPVTIRGPVRPDGVNPLLDPVSLLTQEKRFGPPALFYCSRGGHSTSIVDARGRSVLKGRLHWTSDDTLQAKFALNKLGDVKRLEAFEVKDGKIVIVAFRQGGLEAVDIGDATMTPGDGCRTVYPYFDPPAGSFNRRTPFVWRTGEPIETARSVPASASFSSSPTTGIEYSHAYKRRSTNPASLLSSSNKGNTKAGLLSDGEDEREGSSGIQEDLLVLGRSQDKVYLCDRRYGNFRLMTLEPKAF